MPVVKRSEEIGILPFGEVSREVSLVQIQGRISDKMDEPETDGYGEYEPEEFRMGEEPG